MYTVKKTLLRLSHHLECLELPYLPLFYLLSSNRGRGQEVAPTRALVSGRVLLGNLGRKNIAMEILNYLHCNLEENDDIH